MAAEIGGDDPAVQTELGLAEAATFDFVAAERAFREAIRLDPGRLAAYLDLGLLFENLNRTGDLTALADQAEGGRARPRGGFLRAWALRRAGPLRRGARARRSDAGDDQPGAPRPPDRGTPRPARRRAARFCGVRGDEPRFGCGLAGPAGPDIP